MNGHTDALYCSEKDLKCAFSVKKICSTMHIVTVHHGSTHFSKSEFIMCFKKHYMKDYIKRMSVS